MNNFIFQQGSHRLPKSDSGNHIKSEILGDAGTINLPHVRTRRSILLPNQREEAQQAFVDTLLQAFISLSAIAWYQSIPEIVVPFFIPLAEDTAKLMAEGYCVIPIRAPIGRSYSAHLPYDFSVVGHQVVGTNSAK